jgi:anti-anti-sigma regulatory factor
MQEGWVVIRVHIDKSGGLVTIVFSAKVTAEDARKFSDDIVKVVAEVRAGFELLADLSALESMESGCAPFIAKVMDHCNERGISKVVRVIPDPQKDIGLKILSVFHYDRNVRIITVESLEEAKKVLSVNAGE